MRHAARKVVALHTITGNQRLSFCCDSNHTPMPADLQNPAYWPAKCSILARKTMGFGLQNAAFCKALIISASGRGTKHDTQL